MTIHADRWAAANRRSFARALVPVWLITAAWDFVCASALSVFGSGRYRVQPVFVEDVAEIAVRQSTTMAGATVDAIGPETFTFHELVTLIAAEIGRNPIVVRVPPLLGIFFGRILGVFLRDVLLTRNELKGLMDEKLISEQTPNGVTKFSDWLEKNKATVGSCYSSEVERHFRWSAS